jgi:hypothetical protein
MRSLSTTRRLDATVEVTQWIAGKPSAFLVPLSSLQLIKATPDARDRRRQLATCLVHERVQLQMARPPQQADQC